MYICWNKYGNKLAYIELHICCISLQPLFVHDHKSHTVKQVKGPLILWKIVKVLIIFQFVIVYFQYVHNFYKPIYMKLEDNRFFRV